MFTLNDVMLATRSTGYQDLIDIQSAGAIDIECGFSERVLVGDIREEALIKAHVRMLQAAALTQQITGGAFDPKDYAEAIDSTLGILVSAAMLLYTEKSRLANSDSPAPDWIIGVQ